MEPQLSLGMRNYPVTYDGKVADVIGEMLFGDHVEEAPRSHEELEEPEEAMEPQLGLGMPGCPATYDGKVADVIGEMLFGDHVEEVPRLHEELEEPEEAMEPQLSLGMRNYPVTFDGKAADVIGEMLFGENVEDDDGDADGGGTTSGSLGAGVAGAGAAVQAVTSESMVAALGQFLFGNEDPASIPVPAHLDTPEAGAGLGMNFSKRAGAPPQKVEVRVREGGGAFQSVSLADKRYAQVERSLLEQFPKDHSARAGRRRLVALKRVKDGLELATDAALGQLKAGDELEVTFASSISTSSET